MAIRDSVLFSNILSWDDVDVVVRRYQYTDAGAITLAVAKIGHIVKFDAARANVLGAVALDDAVLEGIIVDLPNNTDVPSGTNKNTVGVALAGAFDKNNVFYSDNTQPISAAGQERLRDLGIFIDPATPAGAFAP